MVKHSATDTNLEVQVFYMLPIIQGNNRIYDYELTYPDPRNKKSKRSAWIFYSGEAPGVRISSVNKKPSCLNNIVL